MVFGNVKEWDLFCALIERDDLALDERFATNRGRIENVDALEAEIQPALRRRTTGEWFETFRDTKVCAIGKVNSIADLFEDEQVAARGMLVDVPMPYGMEGTLQAPNSPVHLSSTPANAARPMPEHGGDTEAVLHSWLGMESAEIEALRSAGAIK